MLARPTCQYNDYKNKLFICIILLKNQILVLLSTGLHLSVGHHFHDQVIFDDPPLDRVSSLGILVGVM